VKAFIALVVLGAVTASTSARADDNGDAEARRCRRGIELAAKRDLPRAALYLESCSDDDGIRVRSEVTHALEATQLSHITVTSMPAGLDGETDALPGERFTTPATIWAKAGTYRITVGGRTVEKVLEPHSRTTVIVEVPAPPKPAKSGVVDFGEEPETHDGPPPTVKHGTMMPKRYRGPSEPAGEPIDDPFAVRTGAARVAWQLGLRASGGIADRSDTQATASIGVAAVAARPLAGPLLMTARLDYAHRELDTIAVEAGVAASVLARRAFVVSAGAALRGEVHVQDTLDAMEVNRAGLAAAAALDVALRAVPVTFGVRAEQGITELTAGACGRALLVEVGYAWR